MKNKQQIKEDLNNIVDTCWTLLSGMNENIISLDKPSDLNRAYNVLLILKDEFKDELEQIKTNNVLPF